VAAVGLEPMPPKRLVSEISTHRHSEFIELFIDIQNDLEVNLKD